MQIKQFRPMFTRVPLSQGMMSPSSQLALDVGAFSLQGAFDESVYGSPREVESHDGIREWSEGLRSEGGGGYVHPYTCCI